MLGAWTTVRVTIGRDWHMQTVGWAGAVVLLLGYFQVSRGRLPGDGTGFQVASVTGSVGLGLEAVDGGVWPAVVVNGLWTVIGTTALIRALRRRRTRPGAAPAGASRR